MKTAISIPDPVFKSGEQLAARLRMSRSELYTTALKVFLDEHREEAITSRLNAVYGAESEPSTLESGLVQLQQRSLSNDKW